MKVVWSPEAVDHVEDIAWYIARDNPTAAKQWIDEVFSIMLALELHPHSGRIVRELDTPEVRELLHKSYRLIYQIGQRIEVLAVWHMRRELRAEDLNLD